MTTEEKVQKIYSHICEEGTETELQAQLDEILEAEGLDEEDDEDEDAD